MHFFWVFSQRLYPLIKVNEIKELPSYSNTWLFKSNISSKASKSSSSQSTSNHQYKFYWQAQDQVVNPHQIIDTDHADKHKLR